MTYTLIIPPKAETAITGFFLAAEKQYYGKTWRVELWRGKEQVRVFLYKNDARVMDSYPRYVQTLIGEANRVLERINSRTTQAA